jgi:acyl-CoA thioesterase I
MPVISAIIDDLPDPEGPRMATVSPGPILSETARKISTGPAALAKVRPTDDKDTTGASDGVLIDMKPWMMKLRFDVYGGFTRICQAWMIALLAALTVPAAAAPPAPKAPLILAFGDSLTAGYELPQSDSFPAQLQAALRAAGVPARVHNAGVSGDTTAAGRARLGWVIAALKTKPDLVILELGANDALRGLEPNATRAHLDAMIVDLKRRGIPILLTGMRAPPNMGRDYAQAFDRIYPELAKKHRLAFYPFFLEGVAANPKLNLSDGIHPNKKGHAIITARILPLVRKTLNR